MHCDSSSTAMPRVFTPACHEGKKSFVNTIRRWMNEQNGPQFSTVRLSLWIWPLIFLQCSATTSLMVFLDFPAKVTFSLNSAKKINICGSCKHTFYSVANKDTFVLHWRSFVALLSVVFFTFYKLLQISIPILRQAFFFLCFFFWFVFFHPSAVK